MWSIWLILRSWIWISLLIVSDNWILLSCFLKEYSDKCEGKNDSITLPPNCSYPFQFTWCWKTNHLVPMPMLSLVLVLLLIMFRKLWCGTLVLNIMWIDNERMRYGRLNIGILHVLKKKIVIFFYCTLCLSDSLLILEELSLFVASENLLYGSPHVYSRVYLALLILTCHYRLDQAVNCFTLLWILSLEVFLPLYLLLIIVLLIELYSFYQD